MNECLDLEFECFDWEQYEEKNVHVNILIFICHSLLFHRKLSINGKKISKILSGSLKDDLLLQFYTDFRIKSAQLYRKKQAKRKFHLMNPTQSQVLRSLYQLQSSHWNLFMNFSLIKSPRNLPENSGDVSRSLSKMIVFGSAKQKLAQKFFLLRWTEIFLFWTSCAARKKRN